MISLLQDALLANPVLGLTFAGIAIGLVFGLILHRTNFCTMGGVADWVSFGDQRRFRAWILAAAVAMLGATLLQANGLVNLDTSLYRAARLNWLGHLLGGSLFGAGMVLASGCPSRNLMRAGTGDLRAWLTLIVMGIIAYITLSGILGPLRMALTDTTALYMSDANIANQGLDSILAASFGTSAKSTYLTTGLALGLGLAIAALATASFRSSRTHVLSGLGVGLCAVAGWLVTGLAYDELSAAPVAANSLTFIRPVSEGLEWLQRSTALGWPGLGPALVIGTIVGAGLSAWLSGRFQLKTFTDLADTLRHLFGAALMGVGGVLSVGCSVGQGVTGVSTLAVGSFLTFAAMVAGAVAMLKYLEARA